DLIDFPIVLNEESHFFTRLEVWATRITSGHKTGFVSQHEVCEGRTGIVGTNAVVTAINKATVLGAVLVISLGATIATTVEVAVLPNAIVAAKLISRISFYDSDCIGDVEVIRREIKRTAIPGEFSGPVLVIQSVNDSHQHDTTRVGTDIDVWSAKLRRNGRTKTTSTVNAGVEDSDLHSRHAKTRIVHNAW